MLQQALKGASAPQSSDVTVMHVRLLSCCMVLLGWIASSVDLLLQALKQAHKQRLRPAGASWNMPPILKLCLLVPFQGFFVFSEPEGVKAKVSWELTYIT